MNTIKDRLREVLFEMKLSQVEFAKRVNLSTPSVSRLLNTGSDPSLPTIQNICEKLGVSLTWLATGKGDMFENPQEQDKLKEAQHSSKVNPSNLSVEELVLKIQSLEEANRRLNDKLASKGSFLNDNKSDNEQALMLVDSNSIHHYPHKSANVEFLSSLASLSLPFLRFGAGHYRAFEIPGDAMSKKVNRGDWVICRRLDSLNSIKDNFVYVIVLEDEVVCRRVVNRLESRKRLRLKADNTSFGDFEVEAEQILEVWEVKSVMTFDLRNPDFEVQSWIKKLEDNIVELSGKQKELEASNIELKKKQRELEDRMS